MTAAFGEIHLEQLVAALSLGHGGPIAQQRQHLLNAGEIAGVTALVEVEHQRVAVCEQAAHHGTTDVDASRPEAVAGPTGHQDAAAAGEQGANVGRGNLRHGRTHVLCWWMSGLGWAA